MDGAVFSFQCRLIKPEEEVPVFVRGRGSELTPEESIFLDDRPENVEAARKCGIHGIVFENFEQASLQLEEELKMNDTVR